MTIKTKNRSEITLHDERRPPRRTPPGQLTEIRDEVTSPRDRRVKPARVPGVASRVPAPPSRTVRPARATGRRAKRRRGRWPKVSRRGPRPSQSVSRSNSYNTSKRAYTGVRRSVRDATIRLVRGSGPSHSAPQPEAEFHNTHKCPAGIKGHPKTLRYTPSTAVCVCRGVYRVFHVHQNAVLGDLVRAPCWVAARLRLSGRGEGEGVEEAEEGR